MLDVVSLPWRYLLRQPIQGRIFAIQFVMANVVSMLPLLFLGGLADLVGVSIVIILVGGLLMLLGLFSVRQSRKLSMPGFEDEPLV